MSNPYDQGFTPTDQEMLDGIRQAIARVAGTGAKYRTPDGRTWEAADIDQLMKLEKYYQSKVDATTSNYSYLELHPARN